MIKREEKLKNAFNRVWKKLKKGVEYNGNRWIILKVDNGIYVAADKNNEKEEYFEVIKTTKGKVLIEKLTAREAINRGYI